MALSYTGFENIWEDGAGREEHLPPTFKSEELELGARLPTWMFSLGARGVGPQRWARGWKPEALPTRLPLPGKHWGTLRPRGPWGGAPIQAPFTAIPPGSLGPHPAPRGGPDAAPAPLRVGPGGTRKGAASAAEFREKAGSRGGEWPSPWRRGSFHPAGPQDPRPPGAGAPAGPPRGRR